MTTSRLLSALIMLATALFLVGALAERSGAHHDRHAAAVEAPASREGGETRPTDESAGEQRHQEGGRETERLAGVDLESTPLLTVAVLAGGALALLGASRRSRDARVMMVIAAATLAWGALDVRELVHALDESRGAIVAIAGAVALLHVGAAAVAALAVRQGYARPVRSSEVSTQ